MAQQDNNEFSPSLPGKRIEAFLDLLGFTKLIKQASEKPELYVEMKRLFEETQREVVEKWRKHFAQRSLPGEDSQAIPQFVQFSDSFVISCPLYPEEADKGALAAHWTIIWAQQYAAKCLLDFGIFVRGGITCGWLYHDGSILLGQGHIDAYTLESRVAKVPRIIVNDGVVSLLNGQVPIDDFLRQDSDGLWFVRPFAQLLEGREEKELQSAEFRNEVIRKFLTAQQHIQNGLREAEKKPRLLEKYRWLVNQFNDAIEKIQHYLGDSVQKIEFSQNAKEEK